MKYCDKKIFITGTSRGLGYELANYFLEEGAFVLGCSRSPQTIHSSHYCHFDIDLTFPNEIREMFRKIKKTHKSISILINNAGVGSSNPTLFERPETITSVINTNILAPLLITREVARLMRKEDSPRIINIGSILSVIKPKGGVSYAVSKSALQAQTSCLAKELGSLSITCNLIGLSIFESEMSNRVHDAFIEEVLAQQSIKRYAQLEDVTNLIDFFARPQSSFVTGQAVFLGGVS